MNKLIAALAMGTAALPAAASAQNAPQLAAMVGRQEVDHLSTFPGSILARPATVM